MKNHKFCRGNHDLGSLMVSNTDEKCDFVFSFWKKGVNPTRLGLWERLKMCFAVLFRGSYHGDQVALDANATEGFSQWLHSRIRWNICKKREKELLTNCRKRTEVSQTYEDWQQ